MSNVAQRNLRGLVETLRIEFAEWDLMKMEWEAPRIRSMTRFRRDGLMSDGEHYNPNGSISR